MSKETKLLLDALKALPANSGVNADKLDGLHSTDFMRSYNVGGTGTDVNTFLTNGSYRLGGNSVNVPASAKNYGNVLVVRGCDADTLAQVSFSYTGNLAWLRTGTISDTSPTSYKDRDWREFAFTDSNVASSQKLQDSSGVYLDRTTLNSLIKRIEALENK